MTVVDRLRYLRVILVLAGLACLALYPLMVFWPSGWAWHVGHLVLLLTGSSRP